MGWVRRGYVRGDSERWNYKPFGEVSTGVTRSLFRSDRAERKAGV